MLKVISATPSPYARKVRIALLEKGVPFELVTDVPWNDDTVVRGHNPLEKLPILITEREGNIYDSSLILEYIELTYPKPALFPAARLPRIAAKTVEVLQNGICDAVVLTFIERQRTSDMQSAEWIARQRRKIERGIEELARLAQGQTFLVDGTFSVADIAAVTAVDYVSVRLPDFEWRALYPDLARYADTASQRPSFQQTKPVTQTIRDKVA